MSHSYSLVTGGGGFIGSHLVKQLLEKQLLEQGETVRVLELPDVQLSSKVEVVRGSICDVSTEQKQS